jgi:hypothetical protein
MPLLNSDTRATMPGAGDPQIRDIVDRIRAEPEDSQEQVAQDAFLQEGYRRLASNMISLAIRDLLREPKVPPAGKNKAHRDAQEARQWLHGTIGSQLSYEDCCSALGMGDWADGLRQFILENPESAEDLFRSYERSYYVHLAPGMTPGLPESAVDDIDVEDEAEADPHAHISFSAAGIEGDGDELHDWPVSESMKAH